MPEASRVVFRAKEGVLCPKHREWFFERKRAFYARSIASGFSSERGLTCPKHREWFFERKKAHYAAHREPTV